MPPNTSVLPAINTNFTHHISAGLTDGTSITGQNAISHPSAPTALADPLDEILAHDNVEDANLPGSLPTLRRQYITFSKLHEEDLPARIERIWYINPYGQEMQFNANKQVLEAIESAQAIIYSIGSLYTSILPNLVLRGVGNLIASPYIKHKILILNSTLDRETGPPFAPYSALDFIAAIARACAYSRGLAAPEEGEYRKYVTHVLHLNGPGTPRVDKEELELLGIECMRVYGRVVEGIVRYDDVGLVQGLEACIGKRDVSGVRSRRNTLER